MELGTIRQINIDAEMQASYLDYAMSVIVARALPDARDGLKPVHRRILYAMHDLGLSSDKPYKKSARIVGEVLGKYHPHGDAAVYEAMVRMAQDFSLRYMLVDGQGNFGSIDGDNAAAMRYTEARLAAISAEMLADIQKDTVDWVDNFDGTLREPSVLPAALPNLLVNGASGIAVGMSTNIPPHNLGEVCDALCYLIDNYRHAEDVTVEDLMRFIPGPDFPTGGVVYRYGEEGNGSEAEQVDVIAKAYAGGRGRIVVQAKAHIEEMSRSRSRIVVTELPYQANKSNLLERIAELVREGRLEGITDLRDESDRTGMRICIEMTRTVEPRDVLAGLFKLTPLQSTFSISLLALVDGEPRLLSLKRILQHYVEHRQDVIVRRSKHDLEKARQRAHILEGLLRALDVLDEVIALIRKSRTADSAKQNLVEQFKFTEIQAQAILDMQLRRLAALERRKLQDEYRQTIALMRELEELLASPAKVLALIRRDLTELKARYGDARRTQIADRTKGALTARDVLPDQEVWVTLSADGMLSRVPRTGTKHPLLASTDTLPLRVLSVNTRQDLYIFSAKGQAARVPIHQIPDGSSAHFADVSGLTRRDRVAAMGAFPQPQGNEPAPGLLLLGTAQGRVKRVTHGDLAGQAHANPQVIALDAGDELVWADISAGAGEILMLTASGQAIRFAEEDVRPMGLPAGGISGIKLQRTDRVVAGCGIGTGIEPQANVAIVTALGYGKQVPLAEFPAQGRSGQGVIAFKPSERSGAVAGAALLLPGDFLICQMTGGTSRSVALSDLPQTSRSALGKIVLQPTKGERIQAVYGAAGAGVGGPPAVESLTKRAAARPKAKPRTEAKQPGNLARAKTANKAGEAAAAQVPKGKTVPSTPTVAASGKAAAIRSDNKTVTPAVTPAATSKTRRAAPAGTAPDEAQFRKSGAKTHAEAPPAKPTGVAKKMEMAPEEEVAIKVMQGRSIPRADLQKLSRTPITAPKKPDTRPADSATGKAVGNKSTAKTAREKSDAGTPAQAKTPARELSVEISEPPAQPAAKPARSGSKAETTKSVPPPPKSATRGTKSGASAEKPPAKPNADKKPSPAPVSKSRRKKTNP